MKPHTMHVDALDVMSKQLTIEIQAKVHNLWRLRLGMWLIAMAGRAMRCRVVVVDPKGEDE